MDDFDKLIEDVSELDDRLADTGPFFAARRESYQASATRVAIAVMAALRPPSVDAGEWRRKSDRVAGRVTTDLMLFGGLILGVDDPGEAGEGVLPAVGERRRAQAVTFEDVKEWVEAGLRGEAGGKRITAADAKLIREKGIDSVAATVMKAYYSRSGASNYGRLRSAIQRYLLGSQVESTPVLDAIAEAWMAHFGPVLERDLAEWAAAVVKRF